jgi:hypothetical protein
MPGIDEFMSQVPIDQLADQLGVDEETAAKTARAAGAVLLGGMEANAQDAGGAASLQEAVAEHDPGLIEGGVDLGQVDTDDGAKIVRNVFGDNEDQIVNTLGGLGDGKGGGLDSGLVRKALPILAPLVLAFLAKSFGGRGQGAQGGGGGLGDILGGLLGGGSGGGGGLGDILGGIVGGGGGGGLGDVLGGLLGGGKR